MLLLLLLVAVLHLFFCLCSSVYDQHGERAVRTPFAPIGFMPKLPVASEPTGVPPAAPTDDTAEVAAEAAAADAVTEQVPEYPDAPESASSVVTLVFPEAVCPERLVFVLHQLGPDTWVRDHGECCWHEGVQVG